MATKRTLNLDHYYSCVEAVARLSENAGRHVDENYPRTLARYGKVRTAKFGGSTIYLKADIDGYVVSTKRGPKSKVVSTKG